MPFQPPPLQPNLLPLLDQVCVPFDRNFFMLSFSFNGLTGSAPHAAAREVVSRAQLRSECLLVLLQAEQFLTRLSLQSGTA
jgi:hypothetical protein